MSALPSEIEAPTAAALWAMSNAELARAAATFHPVDPQALAGHGYRGVSLGLPSLVDRLLWKTFRKEFRRDPETGQIFGGNVRLVQTGVLAPLAESPPSEPMRDRRGEPVRFGPFRVVPQEGRAPSGVEGGVLLDYGATHPRWHVMSVVRDVLVAVRPGSVDLLLGVMHLELGGARIGTPSWFTLERDDGPEAG